MLKKYVCKQGNQIARLSWLTDNVNFKVRKEIKDTKERIESQSKTNKFMTTNKKNVEKNSLQNTALKN